MGTFTENCSSPDCLPFIPWTADEAESPASVSSKQKKKEQKKQDNQTAWKDNNNGTIIEDQHPGPW